MDFLFKRKPHLIVRTTWFDRFVLFLCGGFFFGTLHQSIESGNWFLVILPLICAYVCLTKTFAKMCGGSIQDNGRSIFYDSDVHRIKTSNTVAKLLSSAFGLYVGKFDPDGIEHTFGDYYIGLFFQDGQICQFKHEPPLSTPYGLTPPPQGDYHVTGCVGRGADVDEAIDAMMRPLMVGAELVDECNFNKIRIPPFSSVNELKMKLMLSK